MGIRIRLEIVPVQVCIAIHRVTACVIQLRVYTLSMREQIQYIRSQYLQGEITLDEAKALVKPILADINKRAEAIAKENGFKFKRLTFGYVFR